MRSTLKGWVVHVGLPKQLDLKETANKSWAEGWTSS